TARPAPQPTEARPEQVFSPRTSLFSQPVLAERNAAPPAPRPVSETRRDLRQVAGNRVNMRTGPGTSYGVLATLDRGARVEVLDAPGNGWVKLRVEASGRVGWMAASLLGAAN
ncbi:MAG: SH3 domain-containing protein, partial [Paracoccaceae bacterium]